MTTPLFGLTELGENDPLGHTKVNTALRILECLALGKVVDRDLTAPPGSPAESAMYLVAATATGAWATHDGDLAIYVQGAWAFVNADEGLRIWVADENVHLVWNGSTWAAV